MKIAAYFVKDIPSQGLHIYKLGEDGVEYPMCLMRWSDGMNEEVEKAIKTDALHIAYALNETIGNNSNCCSAPITEPDICSECKEHCEGE